MKKILFLVIGISLGFAGSVVASNWSEIFSAKIDFGDNEVHLYKVSDYPNLCYVSMAKGFNGSISTSVSCLPNAPMQLGSSSVDSAPNVLPSITPVPPEKPVKVFNSSKGR